MSEPPKIGFVGMSHLGLVNAATMARVLNRQVICYDPDEKLIARLKADVVTLGEPGLRDQLKALGDRLLWTHELGMLASCDFIYITRDIDRYDPKAVTDLRVLVDQVVWTRKSGSVLIIMSQVPPGFTRGTPGIEKAKLYYQMDSLVFGRGMALAADPDQLVIGCEREQVVDQGFRDHLEYLLLASGRNPDLHYVSYESAEIAKMSINCYLAASISMTNALAEITERFAHADWKDVRKILHGDPRIGTYTSPGLGIGGGHLLRDVGTALYLAGPAVPPLALLTSILEQSEHMQNWAIAKLHQLKVGKDDTIAIWGLSYKQDTESILDSPAIKLLDRTENPARVHDPLVSSEGYPAHRVTTCATPWEAASGATAVLIMAPHGIYRRGVDLAMIAALMDGNILIDPYRMADPAFAKACGLDYHTIGLGPAQ